MLWYGLKLATKYKVLGPLGRHRLRSSSDCVLSEDTWYELQSDWQMVATHAGLQAA